MGGHDPGALARAHGHHPARGINELIEIVEMQRDYVVCRVVMREGSNLGVTMPQAVENGRLPLLQHLLSQ